MTPCNLVDIYRCLESALCLYRLLSSPLYYLVDGDSTFVCNFGKCLTKLHGVTLKKTSILVFMTVPFPNLRQPLGSGYCIQFFTDFIPFELRHHSSAMTTEAARYFEASVNTQRNVPEHDPLCSYRWEKLKFHILLFIFFSALCFIPCISYLNFPVFCLSCLLHCFPVCFSSFVLLPPLLYFLFAFLLRSLHLTTVFFHSLVCFTLSLLSVFFFISCLICIHFVTSPCPAFYFFLFYSFYYSL